MIIPRVDLKPLVWTLVAGWLLLSLGCANLSAVNPSFSVSRAEAKQALVEMRADPKPLERPVVVMAGWADPFFVNTYWTRRLRATSGEDRVRSFSFIFKGTFDRCRNHVIENVDAAWPSDDPLWTTEVDVVAFSMGGLIARYCNAPRLTEAGTERRLRIRNLYTISTPHLGARLAHIPAFDRRIIDMRSGSDFLAYLDEQWPDVEYTLTAYTRLGDPIVGEQNTAPPGQIPWWVNTPFLHRAHQEAYCDPRIEADILRRLRGEPPFTAAPATPLPSP